MKLHDGIILELLALGLLLMIRREHIEVAATMTIIAIFGLILSVAFEDKLIRWNK